MANDEYELYRDVVGLFSLARREIRDETFLGSQESQESLRVLVAKLNTYNLTYTQRVPLTQEGVSQAVKEAVDQAVAQVGKKLFSGIGICITTFGNFCKVLAAEYPDVDIDALLQMLALDAAAREADELGD